MKDLEKEFVELIDSAIQAKDFMVSELPEVVQQLLTFKFYEYGIELAQCVFFILLGISMVTITIKKFDKWSDGAQVIGVVGSVISVILGSVGFICGIDAIKSLVQIHIAPKVFLIEYTMELIK